MKFRAMFKTPDVIEDALKDAFDHEASPCCCGGWDGEGKKCPSCECNGNCIDCELAEDRLRDKTDEARKMTEKFVAHGEYVTIEFCTDTNTATVVEKGK